MVHKYALFYESICPKFNLNKQVFWTNGVRTFEALLYQTWNDTLFRAVERSCPTCPTWSHFIQDKLKISIYLSLDKYKYIKLIKFCI